MGMWGAFKKSYHDMLKMYGAEAPDAPSLPDEDKWEPIYLKFRSFYGRDPYSMQELRDWWDNL